MIVSALVCAFLARGRGYPVLLYGGLGVLINVGAIPLTLLATSNPLVPSGTRERGLTPSTNQGGDAPVSPQLLAWSQHYNGLRQGLALAGVACLGSSVFLVFLLFASVLPSFVMLFEGMSLQLPLSTQILVRLTKFVAGPNSGFLFWSLNFCFPGLVYALLVYGGYRVPLFGAVWRRTDRLWLLLSNHQRSGLPPEVIRRLGQTPAEQVEDLSQEIQCERDRLSGAIWMAILGIVPLLGLLAFAGGALIVSVFLPLYQLIGNLG